MSAYRTDTGQVYYRIAERKLIDFSLELKRKSKRKKVNIRLNIINLTA